MSESACDFCGATLRPGSAWSFPCRDHRAEPIEGLRLPIVNEGGWAACDRCRKLILDGKREKLAKRAARSIPAPPKVAVPIMRRIHDLFWSNRDGPPEPISREELERGPEPPRLEAA